MNGRNLIGSSVVALAVILAGGAAHAQSTAAPATPAAETDNGGIKDIVVTAERRVSTAQRTPIAMSVFTPEKLAQNGVGTLQDLAQIAPSVNFGLARSQALPVIRGVSSRDGTEIGDPAVSISIDGFYYNRAIGMGDAVFDLDRVEVLRGPQGTLYGRNATGGAINFITAKPKDHFEASAKVGYGNYNDFTTEGMVNLPLNDWIDVRASFSTHTHDGYRNNAPSRNADDADSQAARVHVLLKPSSRLRVLLTGEYNKIGGIGPTLLGVPLQTVGGVVVHNKPALPDNAQDFPLSEPTQSQNGRSIYAKANIEYDFGPVKLTYLGGYRHFHFKRVSDFDGRLLPYYVNSDENMHDQSHELRLASNNDSRFSWQAGGFYFREANVLWSVARAIPDLNQNATTGAQSGFVNYFHYPLIRIKSAALFAQGSFAITPELKIEGGIRYTVDDKHEVGQYITAAAGPLNLTCVMPRFTFSCPGPLINQDSHFHGKKFTYHAALNWQATPNNLLYIKYDTGYKAGGFNQVSAYGPETLTAYEAGAKNRFFDNHLQLNLSAYYYKDNNLQVAQLIQGRTFTVNAGKSEFYGAEVESTVVLSPNDRLDGSLSYLHAEFKDFQLAINGVNTQLAGNSPPQAPRLSFSVGYEHDFHIFGGTVTPRFQTHHESHSFQQVNNYPSDRQDAYWRHDAFISYKPDNGNWTIDAYIRNIGNAAILTWAQERTSPYNSYTYQYEPPRTYGVRLGYKFR